MGLSEWAGIERPFTSSHDGRPDNPVVIRLHENGNGNLLYILNQGVTGEEVTIQLKVPDDSEYALKEILLERIMYKKATNKTLDITTERIPASDVEIWHVKPSQ